MSFVCTPNFFHCFLASLPPFLHSFSPLLPSLPQFFLHFLTLSPPLNLSPCFSPFPLSHYWVSKVALPFCMAAYPYYPSTGFQVGIKTQAITVFPKVNATSSFTKVGNTYTLNLLCWWLFKSVMRTNICIQLRVRIILSTLLNC